MEASAVATAQAELYQELAGLGTSLADGHSILILAAGAAASGKTLTLVGNPEEAKCNGGFLLPNDDNDGDDNERVPTERSASTPTQTATAKQANNPMAKKGHRKGKERHTSEEGTAAEEGRRLLARATPLAGLIPRLMAEAFATLTHRSAQCAFSVNVGAAAVLASPAPTAEGGEAVECLLPTPPRTSKSPLNAPRGDEGGSTQSNSELRGPSRPPPSPPEDTLWGRAARAESPHEVVGIVEAARLRATATSDASSPGRSNRHFLSRLRVELLNHSTKEISACEMIIAELAEEQVGDLWPTALAGVIREHAMGAAITPEKQSSMESHLDPLLVMLRSCLRDTAKVLML